MNFSKQINYGEWKLQALFEQVHAPVDKFFVVLKDKQQKEIACFDMIKQLDHWIIIHPAPEWIIPLQNQLSLLITDTLLN
jgi:hypothetical protein